MHIKESSSGKAEKNCQKGMMLCFAEKSFFRDPKRCCSDFGLCCFFSCLPEVVGPAQTRSECEWGPPVAHLPPASQEMLPLPVTL